MRPRGMYTTAADLDQARSSPGFENIVRVVMGDRNIMGAPVHVGVEVAKDEGVHVGL